MTTTIRTASWTATLALATFALSACDTFDRDGGDALSEPMSVSVRASNNDAAVGDTVTLVSETRNLVGGNASIEWTTTGGTIERSDNDRIARVRFDAPGTYTVTAKAMVNGLVVDTDSAEIQVKDLLPAQPVREPAARDADRDLDDHDAVDRDLNDNGIDDRHETPRPIDRDNDGDPDN